MDGTLGSQTAWMLDGSGVVITSGEELAEIIRAGARAGWPVGVHAIGDRANREALDAFESTREVWAPLGLRQRIEHAQCLSPEDVGRFAALGVACSVQFSHAPSDRDLAERFWAGRTEGAYAFRSLWDSGALVANGSDAPVEELDPLAGIRAGVLRTIDDRPAWGPEQCMTVEQALRATTVNPAWLAGDERTPRQAPTGLPRRPGRPHARSTRVPSRRARVGRGRRHDGRRTLGPQPATLGVASREGSYNPSVASEITSRTMLPVHAAPTCSVAGAAEIVGSKWTVLIVPRPLRGPAAVHRARALVRRDQPANARRAAPLARVRGDRRAAELPGVAAARRVRADRERPSLAPRRARDAPLRPRAGSAVGVHRSRPLRGPAALHRARALVRRDQPATLAERLRWLESEEIVVRQSYPSRRRASSTR